VVRSASRIAKKNRSDAFNKSANDIRKPEFSLIQFATFDVSAIVLIFSGEQKRFHDYR